MHILLFGAFILLCAAIIVFQVLAHIFDWKIIVDTDDKKRERE